MARKAFPPTDAVAPFSETQALVRSTPRPQSHTPDASRNFKLCSLRPGGFRDALRLPLLLLVVVHENPRERRPRESCVLARSFLSRPLSRWMFGVPLTYPKNDASKTVRKGLNMGFGFSRV